MISRVAINCEGCLYHYPALISEYFGSRPFMSYVSIAANVPANFNCLCSLLQLLPVHVVRPHVCCANLHRFQRHYSRVLFVQQESSVIYFVNTNFCMWLHNILLSLHDYFLSSSFFLVYRKDKLNESWDIALSIVTSLLGWGEILVTHRSCPFYSLMGCRRGGV
jgi:hypothetical protein